MKIKRPLNRNLFAVLHDTLMAAASFLLALYLRLGDALLYQQPPFLWLSTAAFTVAAVAFFISFRLYRGLWRYASMRDLLALAKSAALAVVIFYGMLFMFTRLEGIPRSVPVIHLLLLMALLGAPRFLYRVVKDRLVGRRFSLHDDRRIPVLLVGANESTEQFLRETERSVAATYRVVGILEQDSRYHGQQMHGVKIYGELELLPYVLRKLARRGDKPQRIILADRNLDGATVSELLEKADELGLTLARLPKHTEFKSGVDDGVEIRPIAVEDLLGRAQNIHDKSRMQQLVQGKRVLVTGAGGTIGSELVRQLAGFMPASLTLVENSEYNLYLIQQEINDRFPELPCRAVLADVRDANHLDRLFAELEPQILFHSAAIKHVPLAEENALEAILTNVVGTRNVAEACVRHGVLAMVQISTDKAVNPANVMGATKRLAECYCQALGNDPQARGNTRFITVRFGNVLGSTGSVVPLFERQLKRGGPITVTHPEMVRYFMTVREAVELVLQAAAMGARPEEPHHGIIFVLDMGNPVRIVDLATQMIRLAGLRPHEDIEIVFTGLRPGEKLYEELFHYSEKAIPTEHEGIRMASPRKVAVKELSDPLTKLDTACRERHLGEALRLLQKLVPEFAGVPDGNADLVELPKEKAVRKKAAPKRVAKVKAKKTVTAKGKKKAANG